MTSRDERAELELNLDLALVCTLTGHGDEAPEWSLQQRDPSFHHTRRVLRPLTVDEALAIAALLGEEQRVRELVVRQAAWFRQRAVDTAESARASTQRAQVYALETRRVAAKMSRLARRVA